MIDLLLAALLSDSGKPSDPDVVAMWIDDLGRLTPFGRTFDVYIQTGFDPDFSYPDGTPRRPLMIGSTLGNETPINSFGWAINGPVFKNRNDDTYPWLDNCQECIDYYEEDTGSECPSKGAFWDCIQVNPYQRTSYLGAKFTPVNWQFEPGGSIGCCPRQVDLVDLEYAWCDSWLLHGPLGQKYGPGVPQLRYPLVQRQHKNLIESPALKFWTHREDIVGLRCCSAPSQNDYGDLIRWDPDVDWESDKYPGSFHIARFTGPDYFASGGVVRFACGNGHPCEPVNYYVDFFPDNSCPSDLNEDGLVGFQDLIQVLGDVAALKYHPDTNNAFDAVIKVLSEWGQCP